jgi:hypothetical protein
MGGKVGERFSNKRIIRITLYVLHLFIYGGFGYIFRKSCRVIFSLL